MTRPVLDTEERTLRARTLWRVLWTIASVLILVGLIQALVQPDTLVRRALNVLSILVIGIVALALNNRGGTRLASYWTISALTAQLAFRALTSGGITAAANTGFVVVVMAAGLLLGTKGGILFALIAAGFGLVMALSEQAGMLPRAEVLFTPIVSWLFLCQWLGMALALQHQIAAALGESLQHAREEIRRRTLVEADQRNLLQVLDERVKEMRLLHTAAQLLRGDRPSEGDLLGELVRLIPRAWQYPENCEARITFRDLVVTTPGWRESPWRQSVSFATSEGAGAIDVVYLVQHSEADEGPFLTEERRVLESVAEMLVAHVELRRHRENLEGLVASRTQELRTAKEEAEHANRAKSAFLATMSHEIRTPMNAVLGYAQLFRRDPSLTPDQQRRVEAILSSGEHLLTLINNVLEMSRIEAGRSALIVEPVNLHALLDGIEQMFTPLAQQKGLALRCQRARDLPAVVQGDPGKVRQVIINLLSNATKFTASGGIVLSASSERIPQRGYRITIAVQDNGPGIEGANLAHIFSAFEQTDRGATAGGTGLGLTIGRELARMMGGDLTVVSTVGVGSTFTFTFEAGVASEDVAREVVSGTPVGLAPGQPGWKVLVVDDQEENREIATELLARIGFETRAASCGEEGIAVHDDWHPDLVLMDLRMPGIGGLDAIRQLRAAGSTAIIVAFTASALGDMEREATAAGANGVLRKPYREAEMLRAIGDWLDVTYRYEQTAVAAVSAPVEAAGPLPLAQLLASVPAGLRQQLHDAATQARATRIEGLAAEVEHHSMDAAVGVRALTRDFRYDDLAKALDAAVALGGPSA